MKTRSVFLQLLLLAVCLPLTYGPVGHYWNLRGGAPDLLLLSVWAFSWFGGRSAALFWAVLVGLSADLLGFTPFGLWLVVFAGLTLLIQFLKVRFFAVSSVLHALAALAIANVLMISVEFVLSGGIQLAPIVVSVFANFLIAIGLYYLLVIRFHLTEHWEGRQL
ncbi:MAG TPA: hypothetical protein VLE93_03730 [Candidatus Saccharimonadales bacterium]|nr:hypothetical protein [Candidatus Saccharimonadales bacterium]